MNTARLETLSEEKMTARIENVVLKVSYVSKLDQIKKPDLEEREKKPWWIRHTINGERKATEQQKKEMLE